MIIPDERTGDALTESLNALIDLVETMVPAPFVKEREPSPERKENLNPQNS